MFERTVEAFRAARSYQQVHQIRWITHPRWIWRCISFCWYANMVFVLANWIVKPILPLISPWLTLAGTVVLCSIPGLLGMSLLVRACMNIYVIARHVSDPTYENE